MSDDPNKLRNETTDVDAVTIEKQQSRRARIVRQRNLVLVAAVALVALTLIILMIWRLRGSATEAETEVTPTVSVQVVKAEKGTIAAQVTAVGTIWPRERADVAAKISAQIKKMALLKNKVVRAGEVIAVLESRDLQAQRAEAVAALNEARASERSLVTGTIPKTNAEDQKALLDALVTRARALSALGRHDDAAASFERAAGLAERSAPPSRGRQILSAWADSLAALGRHDEAYALARRALASR